MVVLAIGAHVEGSSKFTGLVGEFIIDEAVKGLKMLCAF
jgi:hypothetical protein